MAGEVAEALVDGLAPVFDQPVGVAQEERAGSRAA